MLCGTETDVGGANKIRVDRLPPSLLPVFVAGSWQRVVYADTGIVNDDVQAAEALYYLIECFLDLICVGDISFDCLVSVSFKLGESLIGASLITAKQYCYSRTLFRKRKSDRLANTSSAACN